MNDINIFTQLIKKDAIVPIQTDKHGKHYIQLHEPQCSDSIAIIRNAPSDAFIIKVDIFRSPEAIFNGSKGECKRADYVIITAEKKRILYIEIKLNSGHNWNETVQQLIGAQCFIQYCKEIVKSFWKENKFLTNYEERFIAISGTHLNKRSTRPKCEPLGNHNIPQNALKVTSPHNLQFRQL
ncbi:MAG: hypothetical protein K2Q33_09145, partial [Gammaproteobacteria bacterium]|nr:hypothetical protein [Gammaproteobacteria bacterium]